MLQIYVFTFFLSCRENKTLILISALFRNRTCISFCIKNDTEFLSTNINQPQG